MPNSKLRRSGPTQKRKPSSGGPIKALRRAAYTRLIAANNVVRKAVILIPSHRSKKTYGEQIRILIDVRADLTQLQNEEASSPLFSESSQIINAISSMEDYLDGLINEWKENYEELPVPPKEGWPQIAKLPRLADFLQPKESEFSKHFLDNGYSLALRLMRKDIVRAPEIEPPPTSS